MIRVELNAGHEMLIDADTRGLMEGRGWTARATGKSGYIYVASQYRDGKAKRTILLHRLIMGAGPGQVVDHINGNTLDNRRENLRLCSAKDNARNNKPRRVGAYKGVSKRGARWIATITIDSRQLALGTFGSEIEAAVAYDRAAAEAFGEFARLNFSKDRDWILPVLTHGRRWTWGVRPSA